MLSFISIQFLPFLTFHRDHQAFKEAVSARIHALSVVSLPETQTALVKEIRGMLDRMNAQYEPHYIQVNAEEQTKTLSVQIWYERPHTSLILQNPKQFYVQIEKYDIPIKRVPTPTPIPMPLEKHTSIARAPSPELTPTPRRRRKVRYDEWFTKELESSNPVLVYFWASWCSSCRQASPVVNEASRKFYGKVKTVSINIDKNWRLKSEFGIRGVPTFLIFKQGKVVARQNGFPGKQQFFSFIRQHS